MATCDAQHTGLLSGWMVLMGCVAFYSLTGGNGADGGGDGGGGSAVTVSPWERVVFVPLARARVRGSVGRWVRERAIH